MEVLMFEAERFVADCRAAFSEDPTHKAVREVLASTVSDPAEVLKGLGEPKRAEVQKLFHSDALTIINVVWARNLCENPLLWSLSAAKRTCFSAHMPALPPKVDLVKLSVAVKTPRDHECPQLPNLSGLPWATPGVCRPCCKRHLRHALATF